MLCGFSFLTLEPALFPPAALLSGLQGHTAAPSVSMASSCRPAVSRFLFVVRLDEGSFSCLIPLVLDNTGPGPQAP